MKHPLLEDALLGIQIGVCALIFSMAIRLMKDALKGKIAFFIFILTMILYLGFKLSPIIPILLAANFGLFYWIYFKKVFNK